jgi:hypothetical protein
MKNSTPTKAIRYGMSTFFSSLLAELFRDYNDAAAFVNLIENNITVHQAPSFADTKHVPVPGVDCNGHFFLKKTYFPSAFALLCWSPSMFRLHCCPSLLTQSTTALWQTEVYYISLKNKNTIRALNANHLIYNTMIEFFVTDTLVWANRGICGSAQGVGLCT